ncbi:hypothetical protein BDF14DRAFT_1881210 [Spinellus fusiger]|nr:hypothetical protein BDF14DRAFT_1881210 [Spinellus fusiger]
MSLSILQLPPLNRKKGQKQCTLPSLQSVCEDPLGFPRHHSRTVSLPHTLSLDLLVDAIAIDESLESKYRQHCARKELPKYTIVPYSIPHAALLRKRIHSAPAQFHTPKHSPQWKVLSHHQSTDPEIIAQSIVQQHIAKCIKR